MTPDTCHRASHIVARKGGCSVLTALLFRYSLSHYTRHQKGSTMNRNHAVLLCIVAMLICCSTSFAALRTASIAELDKVTGQCACCSPNSSPNNCTFTDTQPNVNPPGNPCGYHFADGKSICSLMMECGRIHTFGPSKHDTCPNHANGNCTLKNGWCVTGDVYKCTQRPAGCSCDVFDQGVPYGTRQYCGIAFGDTAC